MIDNEIAFAEAIQILKKIAVDDNMNFDDRSQWCWYCWSDEGKEHEDYCIWLRARNLLDKMGVKYE